MREFHRWIMLAKPDVSSPGRNEPSGRSTAIEPDAEGVKREIERLRALASGDRRVLDAILHHSPHGIIICDAAGKLILQNRASERIWAGSATANNVEGWGPYRAFHPDGRPYGPGDWSMARCLANREVVEAEEVHIQRFDGSHGIILCSCAPILTESGELEGALSVFADITRFKQAEERLHLVADALPTLVSYVDAEQRYRFNNLAYQRWVGLAPAELTGRHLSEGLGKAAYDIIRPYVERALRGETVTFQSTIPYATGVERFIEATYVPHFRADGSVHGFVVLVFDISERIRLLEAEREARERTERAHAETKLLYRLADASNRSESLDTVFDASLDAIHGVLAVERASILLFDPDKVMRCKAWRGLSDAYRAAVDGHSPWLPDDKNPEPIFIPDVARDAVMAGYLPLFRSEHIAAVGFVPIVYESRLIGKFMLYCDEPRHFAESEVAVARSIADQIASAVGRRLAQQERERLIEQLSQTVYLTELFSGVLAHDLRNPLGAIVTSAHFALRRVEGERLVQSVTRILRSGERMERMIDQLLDFTRCRVGKGVPVERQEVDLGGLSRDVAGELEESHPERQITMRANGDTTGRWDPDRLAQVVSNLLGNALRHGSNEAPVVLDIDGERPELVVLTVSNRGTIPAAVLPVIFDPFRGAQARDDRHRRQGLGLGLYITHEIVLAHGGSIEVESSRDTNQTTFTVKLPRPERAEHW